MFFNLASQQELVHDQLNLAADV